MEIKEIIEINELLDIYGNLLTNKQNQAMNLYYGEDLSLGEISEELSISRQAVYDNIKKSQQLLYSYEETLGVRKKNIEIEDFKNELIKYLSSFEEKYFANLCETGRLDIKKIIKFCKESNI